jgi:hypothetical protein
MAYMVCARDYRHVHQHAPISVYPLYEFHNVEDDTYSDHTGCLDDNGLCDHVQLLLRNGGNNKRLVLEEIVRHMRQITSKVKEKEDQDSLKAEWKGVAKILDRFFLLLFILVVFISSLVLLCFYPLSSRLRRAHGN